MTTPLRSDGGSNVLRGCLKSPHRPIKKNGSWARVTSPPRLIFSSRSPPSNLSPQSTRRQFQQLEADYAALYAGQHQEPSMRLLVPRDVQERIIQNLPVHLRSYHDYSPNSGKSSLSRSTQSPSPVYDRSRVFGSFQLESRGRKRRIEVEDQPPRDGKKIKLNTSPKALASASAPTVLPAAQIHNITGAIAAGSGSNDDLLRWDEAAGQWEKVN